MLSRSEVIIVEQLTRLKINKYRHIKPGTELRFNSGFNVLLGKNGTGKTTLLDLISIVISSDFSSLNKEEFDLEYELDLPQLLIKVKVRNLLVPRDPETFLQPRSPQELSWSAEATIQIKEESKQYHTTVNQREFIICEDNLPEERYSTKGSLFEGTLSIPLEFLWLLRDEGKIRIPWLKASIILFTEYLRLCRFDEALGIFDLIRGQRSQRLQHHPDIFIRIKKSEQSLLIATSPGFHPDDLAKNVKEKLSENTTLTTVELTEKQVGFLAEFARLTGASTVRVTVSLAQREKPATDWLYDFQITQFAIEYPDGRYITHEKLSYGQKRLLAFLYYLAANEKFVIADELTDSFHHAWIDFCMEKLKTRQCFLSSQNPILLDYLPIGSQEDAQRTFIQCRLEPNGNKEQMVWRNLSDEEAESFYKDLAVGIQSVSEVLMFRGLW
jgi:ABC-type lipoprotein export system ATPase subunit